MKLSTALLLSTTLLSPLALAEGGPRPGTDTMGKGMGMKHGMGGPDCEEMEPCFSEGLKLSNDQEQKIRAIMEESRKKRDALRDDTHKRIKAVLTPEQARKLEEHRADMLKYRAERMRERADRMDQRAREMQGKPGGAGSPMPDSGSPR